MENIFWILFLISFLSMCISAEFEKKMSEFRLCSWFIISAVVCFLTFFVLMYVELFCQPFEFCMCNCNCCK